MVLPRNDKELETAIRRSFNRTLQSTIKEDLVKMYRETVLEVVYGRYNPRKYKRRYSLLRIGTKFNTYSTKGSSLDVYTLAKPNLSKNDYGLVFNLAELVEYGHGYNGNYYNMFNGNFSDHSYARPRPFNRTAFVRASQINYQKYFN